MPAPVTKNKSQEHECVFSKLDSNPCWLCVYVYWEKKEFGWLELLHKEREKKKLADSNQILHLGDCIHACWSVMPTEQVH